MHQHFFLHFQKSVIALVILTLFLAAFPGQGFTQTEEEFIDEFAEEDFGSVLQQVPVPANTVSCFDYYRFGSVQANLTVPVVGTVSGTPITFSGTITNENPYPIVDGALYVKIFRDRGSTNDGNGPDVVDQFLAKSDIVIPANGEVPVSFSWQVPAHAKTGEYKLATFFATSRKFNILGLSFTDDIVGNTTLFRVSGEQEGMVEFDKASVKINDTPYFFAAFPPHENATAPVEVTAKVHNSTNAPQTAGVSWVVYQWDAQLRENVVQEETRQITIPANSTNDVSITVRDTKYPVYLVTGTLSWKDAKSVIGARFVRESVDRTRLNFPGIKSFPLKKGEENTLFSCLHNSGGSDVVPDGHLELTLSDASGNVIHAYNYSGDITSAMMGVADNFTPQDTYDYFTLDARLYQGGAFVDEAHLVYDCKDIDPSLCTPQSATSFATHTLTYSTPITIVAFLVFMLMLWMYRRLTKPHYLDTTNLPPM